MEPGSRAFNPLLSSHDTGCSRGILGNTPVSTLEALALQPSSPQPSSCIFLLGFPLNYSLLFLSKSFSCGHFLLHLCPLLGFLAPSLSRSPGPGSLVTLSCSYSQHTPRCQASPTGNTREGHLMFVGSKALSAVPSLQTWILPASALSKICVWPSAHRQAVGIPVGRKSNTLANLTGGVLSKGQEPHQTQGSICRCQG